MGYRRFPSLCKKTYKLLSGLPHTVHIIVDTSASEEVPSNILSVIRNLDRWVADNQGISVLVGGSEFMETVIPAAKKLAPRATANAFRADSTEEVHAIIARHMLELTPK